MNTQNTHLRKLVSLVVISLTMQACGGAPGGGDGAPSTTGLQGQESIETGDLLIDASSDPAVGSAGEVQGQNAETPPLKERFVRVDFNVFKTALQAVTGQGSSQGEEKGFARIRLNLFNETQITAVIEQGQSLEEENAVLVGRIDGDENSSVTLVMNKDVLVANVRSGSGEEEYEIRYIKDGLHAVRLVSPHDHPEECEPVALTPEAVEVGSNPVDEDGELLSPMATPVIDVLVGYTPRARSYQGGTNAIRALIQMGVADTNTAYINSGANVRIRLVGMIETRHNETGNMLTDLKYLRGTTDGRFDELHRERVRRGADQISLVGSYSGYSSPAGIGYVYSTYASAVTVTKAAYFRQYTFSHELGHNIGLNHSDGYQNSSGRFRTIMAYGSYTRIRRFSSSTRTYNGYRTGSSSYNSAAKLTRYAARLAALRPALASPMAAEEPIEQQLVPMLDIDESQPGDASSGDSQSMDPVLD